MSGHASSGSYRPDIDGLRAVAVLSVLFYHAGLPPFTGGFVGVDVFFVISGFLITGILQAEIEKSKFSLAGFYERRIRRIFPALLFTITLTVAGALALFTSIELERFFQSLAWLALFASNIFFMNNSGYFDAAADQNAILQTWSLAIEEQFYVVFPLLLYALSRQNRIAPRTVLIAIAAASFVYGLIIVDQNARTAFFSPIGRAWELLLGGLVALGAFSPTANARLREAIAAAGATAILASLVWLTHDTPFPGIYALPACAGTAAIIWANTGDQTFVGRGLALPPAVFVGLISYSLYLLHWPVLTFAKYVNQADLTLPEALAALALSFALAVFSWRFIETPFRRPANRAPRATVLATGAAAMAAIAIAAFVAADTYAGAYSTADRQTEAEHQRMLGEKCLIRDTQVFADWPEQQCTTHGEGAPITLWGDSYAAHYFEALRAYAARAHRPLTLVAESSCPPIAGLAVPNRPGCERFNTGVMDRIRATPQGVLIISADWLVYEKKKTLAESFVDKFALLSAALTQIKAAGTRIIVVGPSPIFSAPVPRIAATAKADQMKANVSRKFDAFFRSLEAAHLIEYVPAYEYFCTPAMYCTFREHGELLFWDDGHMTQRGAERVATRLGGLLDRP